MSVTKLKCPRCNKLLVERSKARFGKNCFITYQCGHVFNEKQLAEFQAFSTENETEYDKILSLDGKKLFSFQKEVCLKAELANCNCLIEFQMGLGKTAIADSLIKVHSEELTPCLILSPKKVKWQHFKELVRFAGSSFLLQVIESSSDPFLSGFKGYVMSFDMMRRLKPETLKELGIKSVIIDECQHIKNTKAKRSESLREIISECEIKHVIALSGTPIKNHPMEFFSILNLINPAMFYSKEQFEREWIDYRYDYSKNKYVVKGLKNIEEFHELTKGFIFRKTREEVKEEIGLSVTEAFRDFQYLDIDADIKKSYGETEKEFSDFFVSKELEGTNFSFADYSHILAMFAKMRHLTGLSKVTWTEEFLSSWLTSRDGSLTIKSDSTVPERFQGNTVGEKIAIFTHHIDVAEYLKNCVANICDIESYDWKPIHFSSGLSSDRANELQDEFNYGKSRVFIASTLASGEGLNLQHNCHDAIMMERQWNPPNEEQAESRFIRIGQLADIVTVTYPTVLGTIDEYFTELVEKKRQMLKEVRTGKSSETEWNEQETVMSLAKAIIEKRKGIRWSY